MLFYKQLPSYRFDIKMLVNKIFLQIILQSKSTTDDLHLKKTTEFHLNNHVRR